MKTLKTVIAAAVVTCAAPAFAQEAPAAGAPAIDTIAVMIQNGSKMAVMGMEFAFTYKADGTYADDQGTGGKYRVDGSKLCLTPDSIGQELCSEYPAGKKSGDSFDVTGPQGTATIKIK